jgi:capsular polysaccharide export protein
MIRFKQKNGKIKEITQLADKVISIRKRIKKPSEKDFPYKTYYPDEVTKNPESFESLLLVGENWESNTDKPIIIIYGCNDWKLGFISHYLNDYRTAFVPRKSYKFIKDLILNKTGEFSDTILIWGYTDKYLRALFERKFKKIWRIEDGFIRSSDLGASHSTPLSLVIDKTGFYYNYRSNSEIETLLSNIHGTLSEKEKSQSEILMNYIIENKLSKYNPPVINKNNNTPIRKKIAIIGQVDGDASLRYGNPDGWNSEDLVKLAFIENPGSEIYYRPHPDVYYGYQKSKFKSTSIDSIAHISPPNEDFIQFIESADHIYTITSLSGLEALIRGKKVTTVGIPFYSGWGLTDDRASTTKRNKKITLLELFYAVYIKYPRYLTQEINIESFKATGIKINSDRFINQINLDQNQKNISGNKFILLAKSNSKTFSKNLNAKNISQIFINNSKKSNILLSLVLFSKASNQKQKETILNTLLEILPKEDFKYILIFIYKSTDTDIDFIVRKFLIKYHYYKIERRLTKLSFSKDNDESCQDLDRLYTEYEYLSSISRYQDALKTLFKIALKEKNHTHVLEISIQTFEKVLDLHSVRAINNILINNNISLKNHTPIINILKYIDIFHKLSIDDYLFNAAHILKIRPDLYERLKLGIDNSKFSSEDITKTTTVLRHIGLLNYSHTLTYSKFLISIEKFSTAISILEGLYNKNKDDASLCVMTKALSLDGKLDKAYNLINIRNRTNPNRVTIEEELRLLIRIGDFKTAYGLMQDQEEKNVYISDMYHRKLNFGMRFIYDAFEAFKKMPIREKVINFFSEKYLLNTDQISNLSSLSIISVFGPGDEIRFSSIYRKILSVYPNLQLSITCSSKLHELFKNSYKKIKFIPTERPRVLDNNLLKQRDNIDSIELAYLIDNESYDELVESEKVILATDLLSHFIPDYNSFDSRSYLLPCEKGIIAPLRENMINIGISWRSSLDTATRNEHYLSILDLLPIFGIENINFINLQYDNCESEIEYVNKIFPNKILSVSNLDQTNELDKVSNLISQLDLVISPATTVAELSGALGVKTWLFSNSPEIDWRKKDEFKTDVWHSSVEIVDIDEKGNKEKLVEELVRKLKELS